jgi:hypothetical protein
VAYVLYYEIKGQQHGKGGGDGGESGGGVCTRPRAAQEEWRQERCSSGDKVNVETAHMDVCDPKTHPSGAQARLRPPGEKPPMLAVP